METNEFLQFEGFGSVLRKIGTMGQFTESKSQTITMGIDSVNTRLLRLRVDSRSDPFYGGSNDKTDCSTHLTTIRLEVFWQGDSTHTHQSTSF